MRTIKFRAWNTQQGMKYMDNDFFISADGVIYDRASRTYDTPNLEIEHVENMELMQFTGLLDKNGKEIYEGDIIRIPDSTYLGAYEVRFGDGCWEIHSEDEQGNPNTENLYVWQRPMLVIVIGNIHENPELLEVCK